MLCGSLLHTAGVSPGCGAIAEGVDMSRIDLRVPFNEKEQARRLGARWDPAQKVWYVPAHVDPALLQKWRPRRLTPNILASRFFLATTTRDCWRCAAVTRVVALVLPAGHEALYVGDETADDYRHNSDPPPANRPFAQGPGVGRASGELLPDPPRFYLPPGRARRYKCACVRAFSRERGRAAARRC